MSNPWSVKGIDPKTRGAAKEAARRSGQTLGEWLNQAIMAHEDQMDKNTAPAHRPSDAKTGDDGDWRLSAAPETQRVADALQRLAQRLESSERRQALAMSGLDRTMLGLAARVEDAELGARASGEQVSGAMGELRRLSDQISEQAGKTETLARHAAERAESAASTAHHVQAHLDSRLSGLERTARDSAQQAEQAAKTIASAALSEAEAIRREMEQRAEAAEYAARQATTAAVNEVRANQQVMLSRVEQAEHAGHAAASAALAEMRAAHGDLTSRLDDVARAADGRVQHGIDDLRLQINALQARLHHSEIDARTIAQQTLDEMSAQQNVLSARITDMETGIGLDVQNQLDATRRDLEGQIAQTAQLAQEAHNKLRAGASAAINQLITAQRTLEKKIDSVGAGAMLTAVGATDEIKETQTALAARLEKIERDPARQQDRSALQMLDAKITGLAASVRESRERNDAEIEEKIAGQVRGVEDSIAQLAERLARAEATANEALRTLENSVDAARGMRGEAEDAAHQEAAAFRTIVEQRLDTMAASMGEMVGQVRADLAAQMESGGHGSSAETEAALADVNRRVAAAERRQAHTIEAISIEIKRMSETLDKRLRALETRNDDTVSEAMREEMAHLAQSLELRVADIEKREVAGADRFGAELGRLAERFDDRFEGIERRSADAIEHVGEQVARMAERFAHRQEQIARELSERIVESEERQSHRLGDALSGFSQNLAHADERVNASISPVQKAMTSFADRLQALEDGAHVGGPAIFTHLAEPPPAPASTPPIDIAPPPPPQAEPPAVLLHDDFGDLAPPPLAEEEGDLFPWDDTPAPKFAAQDHDLETEPKSGFTPPLAPKAEPPKTVKEDYLAAARRAAQNSAQTVRVKPDMSGARGGAKAAQAAPGLKGVNKVVLWSAGGALALAIGLGSYAMLQSGDSKASPQKELPPQPPAPAPQAALEPQAEPAAAEVLLDGQANVLDDEINAATIEDAVSRAANPPAASQPGAPAAKAEKTAASGVAIGGVTVEIAAQRGDAVAQYELGLQRLAGGQTPEAVALLRRSANQGLAMAQYRLAKLFERGEGVPVDLAQARLWTERAAAAGNRKAMHDLGVFFARGEGAPFDEAAAFRWFRQAAELGVSDSQFNLGVLYQQGRGTSANPQEALFWYQVAARAGDGDAKARVAGLEQQLGVERATQVKARADAFRPRPASARANGEFGERVWAATTPVKASSRS